jgi:hypothetical protein
MARSSAPLGHPSRLPRGAPPRPRRAPTGAAPSARARLKAFRRASVLAVALTAILLTAWGEEPTHAQDEVVREDEAPRDEPRDEPSEPSVAIEEATGTVRGLVRTFYGLLPKIGVAIGILLVAWLLSMASHAVLRRVLGRWEREEAIAAVVRMVVFLLAIGAALAVLAGDARALVGSVGLVGLALSWALQTPIESATGWLLNSLRGYYRIGDRIEVGDVFGDVYKIDVLTTTVWEAGGPEKAVRGAQPTGAMITFPNGEVLRSKHHQLHARLPVRVGRDQREGRRRERPPLRGRSAGACRDGRGGADDDRAGGTLRPHAPAGAGGVRHRQDADRVRRAKRGLGRLRDPLLGARARAAALGERARDRGGRRARQARAPRAHHGGLPAHARRPDPRVTVAQRLGQTAA